MSYYNELCHAMTELGTYPHTIFVGQGVGCAGTTMSPTLDGVPASSRIEFPVAEDLQIGACIGMTMQGLLPVCIFPRWNFMLRAADGIVNHLDRLVLYSDGGFKPKVIIRTAVPSNTPFDPGPQHDDNFSQAFRFMLRTIKVVELKYPDMIVPSYKEATESAFSTILVEFTHAYRDQRGK